MANEYLINSDDMTAVADAIRAKGGTSDALAFPGGFVEALEAIQAGGGDLTIGDYKLEFGQITPAATGDFQIPWPSTLKTKVYACVWLADSSVIAEKYSDINIMIESHTPIGDRNSEIHYYTGGYSYTVCKTAFGLWFHGIGIEYRSHSNWPAQPETYNWIAIGT